MTTPTAPAPSKRCWKGSTSEKAARAERKQKAYWEDADARSLCPGVLGGQSYRNCKAGRGHLLLWVGVALALDESVTVEQLVETAAMQESEDYGFSAQRICDFLLVEVSGYIQLVLDKKGIEEECRKMCKKLNDGLRIT